MLKSLLVENYALIDRLEIDFEKGLTIVTGETGAGKSILLGAIGLLIGQRADASVLKREDINCVVEGVFDVQQYNLTTLYTQNDIDYHHQTTIRRIISTAGKSRAFINDVPVSLSVLKEFGEHLIDIHSQHQNLLLQSAAFQLKVVDALADNKKERDAYAVTFAEFKQAEKQLRDLEERAKVSGADADYIQHLHQELSQAKLRNGEQAELEEEQQQLAHAEDIKVGFAKVASILSLDEPNVAAMLKEAGVQLEKLGSVFSTATSLATRVDSTLIELKDIASEVEAIAEDTAVNPARLQEVEDRLHLIFTLQKKHRVDTIAQLLALQDELSSKVAFVDNVDEELAKAKARYDAAHKQAVSDAKALSATRTKVFKVIKEQLETMLKDLGMPNATISIAHEVAPVLSAAGHDVVVFLFSGNKGMPVQDIAKVASGGEIARLMLSLKSLIASTGGLPTIIFDEIDTGVSGEVADKMGGIIADLGQVMQVINITHLPQIASKGEAHFWVYKEDTPAGTETRIKQLTKEERVHHIARMLSGQVLTEAAIKNAEELLKR